MVLLADLKSYLNFNSIKVRLELHPTIFDVKFITFQFHKGAIRTPVPGSMAAVIIISIP